MDPSHSCLIPGLPDDISLSCLVRVPRKYHPILNCVSKKWKELVGSEEWLSHRRKHNLDETWIYALCRNLDQQLCCYVLDPKEERSNRKWRLIQSPPPGTLKRTGMCFEALGKKLYLMGGYTNWDDRATNEVHCYDAAMNKWSLAAPLPNARSYFTSEVFDETLYAIGGLGLDSSETNSWDTFDPQINTWKPHFDPNVVLDDRDFGLLLSDNLRHFVKDGKIYIRSSNLAVSSHRNAVVYEPSIEGWHHADMDMMLGWRGPVVVVDGTLYALDEIKGTKLLRWDDDKQDWVGVGRLSNLRTPPPCHLIAIGKSFFVIGQMLSTVMLDVGSERNSRDLLVSSEITRFSYDVDVVSCKCVSI